MPEIEFRNDYLTDRGTDWRAVWSGVFTFMAIWAVFGALGFAIFASAANPAAAFPVTGMSVGIGIWTVILTIIAMYVAGRETGRSARLTTRNDGVWHGMVMFGLSVASVLVLTALGGIALNGTAVGGAHSSYLLSIFSGIGWIGFVALFLGWLAAMGGASHGVTTRARVERPPQQVRPAA